MDNKNRVLPHLPDDLIILILLRLPVKSLLRFKFVSKFFFSLISDTHFTKQHFDLAASPTHRLFYLPHSDYVSLSRSIDLSTSSFHTHNDSVALIPPFLPLSHGIRGSCNGFILLRHLDYDLDYGLFIWNPLTGAHKKLPSSPLTAISCHHPFSCGFGYDPSTDDYLVFLATYDFTFKTNLESFSLRGNAWNTIEVNDFSYDLECLNRTGILLNGVLHWLAYLDDMKTRVIIAFDLKEKSFSNVPLPRPLDYFYEMNNGYADLCVIDGNLCLSVPKDNAIEIWVMNEYKVPSSWKKTLELCKTSEAINPIYCHPKHYFSPRYSTKCGDIVGVNGGTREVKFNAKRQRLERHSYLKVDDDDPHAYRWEAIMYTESLLQFPS